MFTALNTIRWKIFLPIAIANVALMLFLAQSTRALRSENMRLSAAITREPPAKTNKQAEFLRLENERLKAELKTIPELAGTSKRLRNELHLKELEQPAKWAVLSNQLHAAIERKQSELAELRDWSKNWERTKQVRAAEARLAEKAGLPAPADARAEYERLNKIFAGLAAATRRRLELQREWWSSGKSEERRAAFLAGMTEYVAQHEAAMQQLGSDRVLFEELPLHPNNENPGSAPLLRSVIPDLQGLSATLHLDGTVTWAPAAAAASPAASN